MAKSPAVEQESLFAVARETGGIVVPPEVDESSPSVGIVERAIHLHNTLSLFSEVNVRQGLVDGLQRTRPEVLKHRYGDGADKVVAGAEANAKASFLEAKWEFARAFGFFAIEQSGQVPMDRLKNRAQKSFTNLWQRFGLPSTVIERNNKKDQLEKVITGIQDSYTQSHREEGVRPHKELVEESDRSQLGTQDRLRAVNGDMRAGFLPTTRRELHRTLSFLDYLDNPAHPFGIRDQLFEVYCHQMSGKTIDEEAYAMESIESITFEIGQNLTDATNQLGHLRDLELRISDCPNPNVSLAEEIAAGHPGLAPLVRFLDLREFMTTGRVEGLRRDPLRSHRNEEAADLPGKNKIIEDPYTRLEPTKYFEKYLAKQYKKLKIGPMRQAVRGAILDQEKRQFFAGMRVRDIAEAREAKSFATAQQAARLVLKKLAS